MRGSSFVGVSEWFPKYSNKSPKKEARIFQAGRSNHKHTGALASHRGTNLAA
jgi:hypothetical protein